MRRIVLVLLAIVFSQSSEAFTLTYSSSNKGYENPNIEILINQSSCPDAINLRQIVSDAVEVWNEVATSRLNLSVGGDSTATTYNYPPVAYCDSTITGTTLGQGGSQFSSTSNHLLAGLLRLNTNSGAAGYVLNQSMDRIILVAAHELGHMFGLGHSPDAFALMHYSITSKEFITLSQDDIDGVTYLYPRDEWTKDPMLGGCGSVQYGGPSNTLAIMCLVLPLLLAGYLRFVSSSNRRSTC